MYCNCGFVALKTQTNLDKTVQNLCSLKFYLSEAIKLMMAIIYFLFAVDKINLRKLFFPHFIIYFIYTYLSVYLSIYKYMCAYIFVWIFTWYLGKVNFMKISFPILKALKIMIKMTWSWSLIKWKDLRFWNLKLY